MSGASWKRSGKGGRLQGARAPRAAAEEEEWYTCRRHNRHAMGEKKVDGGCREGGEGCKTPQKMRPKLCFQLPGSIASFA